MKPNLNDEPRLLREMIDALSQAEGSCSQLLHQLQAPHFIVLREALNSAKELAIQYATLKVSMLSTVKK